MLMTVGKTKAGEDGLQHRLYLSAVVLASVFAVGVIGAQLAVRVHHYLAHKEDMACHERLWREAFVTLRDARRDDVARPEVGSRPST